MLADKGYLGAGIGVHTPAKRPVGGAVLHTDTRTYNRLTRTYNRLLIALRARPSRLTRSSAAGGHCIGSLSAPGGSPSSWPPPSCSPQCSEVAGEKPQ